MPEAEATALPTFVQGGPLRARPTRASAFAWVVAAAVFLLPVPGLMRGVGSSMEEGFMLVFPHRLLQGDLPNRDYLHLYGPGSIHVLAGWYWLFGYTLEAQRVFGLLQHAALVAAAYTLCRPWGYRVAVAASILMTTLMLTPSGLAALAWPGGLALGLWSVVMGIRALHQVDLVRRRSLLIGGILGGLSLSFRPDLIVCLVLAWAVIWWRSNRSWAPLLGAAVGSLSTWVHIALVGLPAFWTGVVVDPVVHLRPGRNLPRPPSWTDMDGALQALNEKPFDSPWWRLPALPAPHQLFIWFFVVIIVNLGAAFVFWWWSRRAPAGHRVHVGLIAGLFAAGLTGQAVQRADSTHLAWGCCVGFALIPALVHEWGDRHPAALPGRIAAPMPLVISGLVLFVVCPFYTLRPYLLNSRISVGNLPGGYEVTRDDKHFYLGNRALQAASQAAVDQLDALSKPGDRLIVGPADLSRTVYNDVVFYSLFPDLVPGTYYIEMDPGLADREGSRLAGDVESSNFLILTNFWTGWYEPNSSATFGSQAANQVVARDFCLVGNYDNALVLLYQRCAQGDGVDPATIGIGPQRRAAMEAEKARRTGQR